MNFFQKNFKQSGFLANVLKLLSANLMVQLVSFLLATIITRLYSDNDFGLFAKFMSVANIFIILATARLEFAIILPKEDKEANTIVSMGIFFSFLSAALSFIFLFLFKEHLNDYFQVDMFQKWVFLMPIVVFFSGVFSLLINLKNRRKKYGQMAIGQSLLGISNPLVTIGVSNILNNGLIHGVLTANILGSIFLSYDFLKEKLYSKTLNFKNTLIKYYRFPTYNMAHALVNTVSANLPVFMLSAVFENYLIGLFTMALGKVFKPINLFGNSVYQVLSKKMVDDIHNKIVVVDQFMKILKMLFLIGFLPFLMLYFGAEQIFAFVFGAQWAEAGFYLKTLLPWLFMIYLVSSFSFIPNIFRQQKMALFIELIFLVFRVWALYYGISKMDLSLALTLFSWVGALMLLVNLVWYYYLLKNIKEIDF